MLFLLAVACQTDPIAAIGLAPEIVGPHERPLEIPTTPPMDGALLEMGGVATTQPEPAAAPPPPPPVPKFDPISVPQGPRETSVKWEGVTGRGTKATDIPDSGGEKAVSGVMD